MSILTAGLTARLAAGLTAGLVAAFVAGCGAKAQSQSGQPQAGQAVPIPEGVGCPAAESVMVAVYREASSDGPGRWNLPLANRSSEATTASYQVLDAAAAAAAGIPAPPPMVWLLQVGAPPCQATPGAFFADTVIDGPANDVLGVELTSACPAPAKDHPVQAIAVASEIAPTGCVALLPRPVAGRVGEVRGSSWQILSQSAPMPPAVEAALPRKDCVAPCEPLWTVAQVDFAGKPIAWDVAVEWLHVDRGQPDACKWASEGDGGVLFATAAGTAERVVDAQITTALHLGAVLADRSGPKVMMLEHIGEYAMFQLGGGAPRLAKHLRWYLPNEELYGGDRKLGPYCGP